MSKERYNQIVDEVYENFLMMSKKRVSKEMIEKFVKNTPKVEFINKIKTDERFSKYWGLKIEERELILKERVDIFNLKMIKEGIRTQIATVDVNEEYWRSNLNEIDIPTKLITVTYYNETIEIYE